MTESQRRAIKQIRVLWPHLGFQQRYEWVNHLRHLYDDDLTRTVEALSGFAVHGSMMSSIHQ